MASIVQNVSFVLSAAGYRVGDASPGSIMPEIEEPVVAVSLEQLDGVKNTVTVRATVVSPMHLGARRCEDEALKVCRVLQEAGAQCKMEPYKLDVKTELFLLPVMAVFYGNVLDSGWQVGGECSVSFGSVPLQKILSFTAWRETSWEGGVLTDMAWRFRVEERLDGIQTDAEPVQPMVMTVSFEDGEEIYGSCNLTLQKRVLVDGCLHQVWEGVAQTRTVSG